MRKLRLTDLARQPARVDTPGGRTQLACWYPCSVSILKEINPEFSLEGPILKLKLQYFGAFFFGKDPDAGKDWSQKEKGATKGEMVRLRHRLSGHESKQAPGESEGRGAWQAAVQSGGND